MLAAIDVGSNTVRLLLGETDGGRVIPHRYERSVTRLGGGFTTAEGLAGDAMNRTLAALRQFAALCAENPPAKIRAVGTAALRSSANGQAFIETVNRETGLAIDIISGDEEARLTAAGALAALEPTPPACLIVDIGGGSTEFVLVVEGRVRWLASRPLGVVRLMEDCSTREQRDASIAPVVASVVADAAAACGRCGVAPEALAIVGTAGTVTTLAALDMQMSAYDWRRVNNYRLSVERVRSWHARLAPLAAETRELLPGMERGRGDLIIAGIEIIQKLLAGFAAAQLVVSDFGILEGLLLSLHDDLRSARN